MSPASLPRVYAVRSLATSGRGTIALEPSTGYETYLRLAASLGGGWQFVDGAPVTERLRIIKAPEEVALIRRAIEITEGAIAATFGQLAGGMTERDVARLLSREMQQRGAEGGGLVQFGPASALPHGGPAAAPLKRETVVLIDCGCRVSGYDSDITRMTWFGDHPADEFRKVFDVVHDAQTAAMQLGRPRVTQCQEMDRAARKVIADAGYGPFFTHRLGHGLGMDGHEVPYLVEGNAGGGDEPSAEFRAAQSAEGIHPKEEVEGPQGVDELDPRQLLPEPRHHEIAPLAELGHHPRDVLLHPSVAERRRGGELRRMVRARRGVRLQRRHRSRHRAGSERRADAPPGHRVRFAHTVDHDDALQQIVGQVEKRRRRPRAVMDASVDLVRDDPHLPLARPLRDRLDLGVGVHRPRGIAR